MGRIRDIFPTVTMCLAGLAFSAFLFGPQIARTYLGANDFVGFYTAGLLAHSRDLYDIQGFMQAQGRATGFMSDQILFVRLPWQALSFTPFTILPFPAAHIAWTLVCVLAIYGFTACWPKVPTTIRAIIICWTIPVFVALTVGQDVPLLLLALGGGFLLIDRDRHFLAGMCLAFALAKPHLLWPLALALLWHRMWRVCVGGSVGCAALLAISFLTGGSDWIQRSMRVMQYSDQHSRLSLMPTLHSALLTVGYAGVLEVVSSLLLVAAILRGSTWKRSAAIALIVGILLGRHAFMADCALLLSALFLSWQVPRARAVLLVLISPVTFVPGILVGVPWIVVVLFGGALTLGAFEVRRNATSNFVVAK